jgi:hypothetical protein
VSIVPSILNWVGNLRREERERRKKEKSEGRGVFIGNPGSPKQRHLRCDISAPPHVLGLAAFFHFYLKKK